MEKRGSHAHAVEDLADSGAVGRALLRSETQAEAQTVVGGGTGPQGPKGDTGDTGPQGPAGPAGADGATGLQGPQGNAGPQGPSGAAGAQGPQGPAGADGAQGPQGAQGIQGPQGDAGPQGPAAAWGNITGTLSNQTDLQTALNAKQAAGTYATGTGSASGTNTGDQIITLTGDVTGSGTGSFATTIGAGKVTDAMRVETSAAAPATTGTMTVNMTSDIITITPTGACTFNASGGRTGRIITFSITTSGTTSFTLTWGTNFRKVGTLATGTTSARFFAVTFRCLNGTTWQEICRTAVQT